MPLRISTTPPAATHAVRAVLTDMAVQAQFRTAQLRRAAPQDLGLAAPHGVYTLALDDIAQRRGLAAAQFSGWRYLVQDGDRTIASAEATAGQDGAPPAFSQLNEGPFSSGTADAIQYAEALPQLRQDTFELRLLRIPALYVVALWLKEDSGTVDLIIPVAPAPPQLRAESVYIPADFFAALEQPARDVLAGPSTAE
jgi:hypothetical protein